MKVEIWSDIVCPFCYIGKRNFEKATEQFEYNDEIEVIWRSFELSPGLKTDPSQNIHEYLAAKKGWTLDYAKKVNRHVIETAKTVGLDYQLDKTFPVNSFNAHRLLHLTSKHNLQNEMKERLFAAHFTEGENVDDKDTLIRLGAEVGIPDIEMKEVLDSELYKDDVKSDIQTARKVGVQGVPFFVFNNKYAVSGAQPSHVFLEVLQKVKAEMEEEGKINTPSNDGAVFCSPEGDC